MWRKALSTDATVSRLGDRGDVIIRGQVFVNGNTKAFDVIR